METTRKLTLLLGGEPFISGDVVCTYRFGDDQQLSKKGFPESWEIDVNSITEFLRKSDKPAVWHCSVGKDQRWYICSGNAIKDVSNIDSICTIWLTHIALYKVYKIDIEALISFRSYLEKGGNFETWESPDYLNKECMDKETLYSLSKESLECKNIIKFIKEKTDATIIIE